MKTENKACSTQGTEFKEEGEILSMSEGSLTRHRFCNKSTNTLHPFPKGKGASME